MKKNLEDIREDLEIEIDTAQGLSEIMLIIGANSRSFERNGITFENISSAFSLIAKLFDEHVQNLNTLANKLVDFHNDIKVK